MDSRRTFDSKWQKNGHLVVVNCHMGLLRTSIAGITVHAKNDLKCIEGCKIQCNKVIQHKNKPQSELSGHLVT